MAEVIKLLNYDCSVQLYYIISCKLFASREIFVCSFQHVNQTNFTHDWIKCAHAVYHSIGQTHTGNINLIVYTHWHHNLRIKHQPHSQYIYHNYGPYMSQ